MKPAASSVATSLADPELPDPGSDSIISTAAIIGTLLGGADSLCMGASVERGGLLGGLGGAAAGLVLYSVALIGGEL